MSATETELAAAALRELYDRRIAAKVIAEFCHERALAPLEAGPGRFTLLSDDQRTEYTFDAELLALDSWAVDDASLRRTRDGEELPVRAVDLVVDLHAQLGIARTSLPEYLEELIHTVAIGADRSDDKRIAAVDLAAADFQTIEKSMTEGHPCFVANAGRLGFSAHDIAAYAPESGGRFRLIWIAARSEDCDVATVGDVAYDDLLRHELGGETMEKFADVLLLQGLDPGAYTFLPVHPWQWTEKAARLYAADLADQRLVILGASPDLYQPQQSIRTQFNASTPTRHYVKTALSIVNMGFTRGMSADYMRTTPLINDWVRNRIGDDPYLRSLGFELLYEVAAVGYRNPTFTAITEPGSGYRKMLSALWRQSPIPRVAADEQLMTMAALLHIDHRGTPLIGEFIVRSGLTADDWLARYLRTYLHPITYLLYRHQLKFSPHGENLILVLRDGIPVRAILKDIGEEVCVFDEPDDLPASCSRALTSQPDAIGNLGVLSDVFDDFLRPLASVLHRHGLLDDARFWSVVGASVREFVGAHPELDDVFARWDLFAPTFPAVHMNALQLGDNRRMVNVGDSYESMLDDDHQLTNPIADS